MSNMGYCRFQNTVPDLEDCQEHINDADLSKDEKAARDRLLDLCADILEEAQDDRP